MKVIVALIVGAASGLLASMGLGGGFILLVYLALFGEMGQADAQGMNLLFFIPIIVVSLVFHIKNKLIDFKTALICGAAGAVSVFAGFWVATAVDNDLLRKLFAVFVIIAGVKDVFSKSEKAKAENSGEVPKDPEIDGYHFAK